MQIFPDHRFSDLTVKLRLRLETYLKRKRNAKIEKILMSKSDIFMYQHVTQI